MRDRIVEQKSPTLLGISLLGNVPTGWATSLLLRSRTGVRASLMALTFASGSRAVAHSTASDAVHNAVHGAFMTLPAYSRSREDGENKGHEPGFGVRNGSSTARSRPVEASRERMERAGEGPSVQGTARCVSCMTSLPRQKGGFLTSCEEGTQSERPFHLPIASKRCCVEASRCMSSRYS